MKSYKIQNKIHIIRHQLVRQIKISFNQIIMKIIKLMKSNYYRIKYKCFFKPTLKQNLTVLIKVQMTNHLRLILNQKNKLNQVKKYLLNNLQLIIIIILNQHKRRFFIRCANSYTIYPLLQRIISRAKHLVHLHLILNPYHLQL